VTGDEIHVALGRRVLLDFMQKHKLKIHFSRDAFLESLFFPISMSQNRLELILKFLHPVDSSTICTYTVSSELFNIEPTVNSLLPSCVLSGSI
jgi:hypothetical protein